LIAIAVFVVFGRTKLACYGPQPPPQVTMENRLLVILSLRLIRAW